jgi:murein DD-endopeptidase MepM/ murein hydrolase activator NlpD
VDIGAIVERARVAAAQARKDGQPVDDREQLKRVAAEFESMLLVQMLKDMRAAGSWDETEGRDTLGAEAMFETLDVELATYLARAKGMGLKEELLRAFERMQPEGPTPGGAGLQTGPPATRALPPADLKVGPSKTVELGRPVDGAITSDFGWRRDPFTGRARFHQGVDMRAAYGQEVQAAGAGRVVFSGEQGGYGTSVVIEHLDGTRTRYAHLSAALVAEGNEVAQGAAIVRAGRSGRATGTHLHFEVIAADGRRLPPEQWTRQMRTATAAD